MKLVFAGTPEFAATALSALLAAGHQVPLVLTQPDRPAGRGMKLQPSAVKRVALAHGCTLYQPERLKDPATHAPIAAAVAAGAEMMIVAAYGLILPQAVLDLPARGCINIHASLLPRWRGAAPIQRAIEAGDHETGITLMQMDAGLDTGAMLMRHSLTIHDTDTAGSLHDRLAELGAQAIVQALDRVDQWQATAQPEQGVTYASKISKAEASIDWQQPAEQLARRIRAFNPFPGASTLHDGSPLKLWQAQALSQPPSSPHAPPGQILAVDQDGILVACGQGVLRLTELQNPGGRRLPAREYLTGGKLGPGMRLG